MKLLTQRIWCLHGDAFGALQTLVAGVAAGSVQSMESLKLRGRVLAEQYSRPQLSGTARAVNLCVARARERGKVAGQMASHLKPELGMAGVKGTPGQGPWRIGSVGIVTVAGVLARCPEDVQDSEGNAFGTAYETLAAQVEYLCAQPGISAVLMVIDSPGGSSDGIRQCGERLQAASGASGKRLAAYCLGMAASAGYWIATLASPGLLLVSSDGWVGSIGALSVHFDHSKMLAEAGITPTVMASTPTKAIGIDVAPLDEKGKSVLMAELMQSDHDFVTRVMEGRRVDAAAIDSWRQNIRGMQGRAAVDGKMADAWASDLEAALALIENPAAAAATPGGGGSGRTQLSKPQGSPRMNRTAIVSLIAGTGVSAADAEGHVAALEKAAVESALKGPPAASLAELRGTFKDDPAFVLDALEKGLSMDQARGKANELALARAEKTATEAQAKVSELSAANTKLSEQVKALESARGGVIASLNARGVAPGHPGVSGTGTPGGGGGAVAGGGGKGPAKAEWDALVAQIRKEENVSADQAISLAVQRNPELHAKYEAELNQRAA